MPGQICEPRPSVQLCHTWHSCSVQAYAVLACVLKAVLCVKQQHLAIIQ
jgi:hypothetical protein